jgi:geranylgeranyl diphosphate synthase type II
MSDLPLAVARTLASDHELVQSAVRRAIPDAEPRRYLYEPVAAYTARSGKGFRASLCLATCRAFGGRTDDALHAATALELLHNAFLIHDDIEDDSKLRRGAPALHRSHGVALALNAGDGLCGLALSEFARCAARFPELGVAMFAEVAHLFRRSVEGQAWELGWIADGCFTVTEADYLRMVLGKTCWYSTIHPLRLGALLGSRGKANLEKLVPFGIYVGLAFQIRDDVENLIPASGTYGKDVGGDILEGKRTLPLLHLLEHASSAGQAEALQLLSNVFDREPGERVRRMVELMTECGSIDHARQMADGFARMALEQLSAAFGQARSGEDVEYLAAMVLYLSGSMELGAPVSES